MNDKLIVQAYSAPQFGGDLPYFVGRQYGSGRLRDIAKFAFPILKRVVGGLGSVAASTAEDMIEKRKPFRESLKSNAGKEALKVMRGKGIKRRRVSKGIKRRKKARTVFDF
jgi:hypothetical protein